MHKVQIRFQALKLILLVAVALAPITSSSQAISGDVVGRITDPTGIGIRSASIVATNVARSVKVRVTADTDGYYRFSNLQTGTYDFEASTPKFSPKVLTGVVVRLNTTVTVNLVLQIATKTETVEVTDSALPPLDTSTAQIVTTYNRKQIEGVPTAMNGGVSGWGVLNLSLLQAGVADAGSIGEGIGPSVGGQRPRNNNFMIEGVDNNDKSTTGPLAYIPNDAVEEFSILQNQFSAEFGHSSGGQFNQVVKTGTKSYRGTLYEYYQNETLNAIDQTFKNEGITENPRYESNRSGGQIGGPILKNKLFFFVNFEYNPVNQTAAPSSPALAPTAAGYSALLADPGLPTNNINVLKQYAIASTACTVALVTAGICPSTSVMISTPSSGRVPVEIGVLPILGKSSSDNTNLATAMDYDLSDKDQIRGRYIYNRLKLTDSGAELPIFYTPEIEPTQLVTLAEYHQFSPVAMNEFRIGFNRYSNNYTLPNLQFAGLDSFPNIIIDELNSVGLGADVIAPQSRVQNAYSAVDNVTWVRGVHTLKFGVEGLKYIALTNFTPYSRGYYDYSTLSDYVNDVVPATAMRLTGPAYSGNNSAIYGFVNDTWKVRPDLSVNLGLRYEYTSIPHGLSQQGLNSVSDVPGLITFGSPQAPKTDFMPRLGFAWSPRGNNTTVVRGGFGTSYDVLPDNLGTLSQPPQLGASAVVCPNPSDPSCPTSNFLANGGIRARNFSVSVLSPADARAVTGWWIPNNIKYPKAINWSLGVQRLLGRNFTVEVRYLGSRGVHLPLQDWVNTQPVVTVSNSLPTYLSAPSQADLDALPTTLAQLQKSFNNGGFFIPAYANAGFVTPMVSFEPLGNSIYHGLQTQLNRRFSRGLMFQAAWTWSHTIDNSTPDVHSTDLIPRRPQDPLNLSAERSNSALDRRHNIALTTVWDVPFPHAKDLVKNMLGNWQLATTYHYESGQWATVQSLVDSNLNGDSAGDRAIYNPNGVPGVGSGVTPLTNSSGDVVAYVANNPNAQFIAAGKGALATAGRNSLQLPAIDNVDMAVTKRVIVNERWRMEFGAQLFNAVNHPQYLPGSINTVSGMNTIPQGEKNFVNPSLSTFDNAKLDFSSNPRTVQLSAKIIF